MGSFSWRRSMDRLDAVGRRAAVLLLAAALGLGAAPTPAAGTRAGGEAGFKPGNRAEAYFHYAMAKMAQRQQRFDAALNFLKEAAEADPGSSTIRAELARTYFTVRDYPAAEAEARAALALDPDNSVAHTVLAQLFYSRARRGIEPDENRQRAMLELEASLTGGDRDDPEVLLTLGRFYFEAGDYAKAASILQRFVDTQPAAGPSPLFLLARAYIQLERYDSAEQTLHQVLELAPDSLQALETLVNVKRLQEDYEGSLPLLRRILAIQGGDASIYKKLGEASYHLGRFSEAVEMFEMARREEPGSPYTLYYLGLSYERLGQFSQARRTFNQMLERDPENAEVLFRLARLEEQQGDLDTAVQHYRALVSSLQEVEDMDDPRRRDVATFCARVGVLLMELARYGEAVKEVRGCMGSVDAPAPLLHLLLVRALVLSGQEQRAMEEARQAVRTFPDQIRFAVLEGEVLLQMGRDAEGERRLRELIQRVPADGPSGGASLEGEEVEEDREEVTSLVSDAFFNAGARAEGRGDLTRAEQLLKKAIDINPEHAAALNYLGYTWADRNVNLEEALDLIQRAVKLEPDNGAFLDSLGWVHFRLGNLDDARRHLRRAVEILGSDPTIQEHLGDVEAAAGNMQVAEKLWRRALDLGADNASEFEGKMRGAGRPAGP